MICPECKKEISDKARFCRFCGTKIEKKEIPQPKAEMKDCPFCGKSVKRAAKFCRFCGKDIGSWKPESSEKTVPVFEEEPPVFEENPPVFEEEPPVFEEEPPVSEEEPLVSEEGPPLFEEEPPVSEEEPPVSEEEPLVFEEEPPVFEEEPPVSEEEPPVSEEKPSIPAAEPVQEKKTEEPVLKEILLSETMVSDETAEKKKKSVDIDESIFEEDRDFLYEGITMETSEQPLWGMPSVNADKLAALENSCRKDDEAEFQPYYRTLRPIAFTRKDTAPESIFSSSLGNYALQREPEPVKMEEEKTADQAHDNETGPIVNKDKMQIADRIIDDSRKEVLSQKINSDSSGYVILAFLGALLLFTVVVVGFTRLILPRLSADAGKNGEICQEIICPAETADINLFGDLSVNGYDLIEEL